MASETINFSYNTTSGQVVKLSHDDTPPSGFANGTFTGEIPDWVAPYSCRWDTTNSVFIGGSGQSSANTLKDSAYTALNALDGWVEGLAEQGKVHPASEVNIGHDFLCYGYWGLYLVMQNSTQYTAAKRQAFAYKFADGAADTTSPTEFFQEVHKLTSAQEPSADTPVVWVNPDDATQWSLADIVSNSASEFTTANGYPSDMDMSNTDIRGGAWVATLT